MAFKGKKVVKVSSRSHKGPSKTFGNSKKNISRPQSSSSSSSCSDLSDSSESNTSEVEIKFEFFNMSESDYHSIKQYLANSFGAGDHEVNLVGLTSFIVESLADHLGTCIKTDGENSDPFGFLTGFPISFAIRNDSNFLKSYESFINQKCPQLSDFFSNGKNVILFQERLINVPGSIAAPLYRQFMDDWNLAAEEDDEHFGNPKNVLIISPTYKEIISQLDRELGLKENPSKFDCVSSETCYYYEEAEYLKKFSTKFFEFSVNTGHETSDSRRAFSENGIEPGRQAFLLSWQNFTEFIEHLESEI